MYSGDLSKQDDARLVQCMAFSARQKVYLVFESYLMSIPIIRVMGLKSCVISITISRGLHCTVTPSPPTPPPLVITSCSDSFRNLKSKFPTHYTQIVNLQAKS